MVDNDDNDNVVFLLRFFNCRISASFPYQTRSRLSKSELTDFNKRAGNADFDVRPGLPARRLCIKPISKLSITYQDKPFRGNCSLDAS